MLKSDTDRPESKWASQLLQNGFGMHNIEESKYLILVEHDPKTLKAKVDPATIEGSDEVQSCTGTGVTLKQHMDGLGNLVAEFAKRLGLPQSLQDDMRLLADCTTIGKVDPRFQLQLVGGDPSIRGRSSKTLGQIFT